MKKLVILGMVFVFSSLSLGLLTIDAHAENKGVVVIPLFETKALTESIQVGIKVYDADNQDLGLFIDTDGSIIKIYILGLKAVASLDLLTGHIWIPNGAYFESNDCSGTPRRPETTIWRYPDGAGGYRYYKPFLKHLALDMNSHNLFGPDCLEGLLSGIPVPENVEIAEEDIPFNLPVALPLRLE